MTTHRTLEIRVSWTVLGARMGYTSELLQRDLILDAAARMTWTDDIARVRYLTGAAVQEVIRAFAGHCHLHPLRRVGVAQLNGAQLLIGLEHRGGQRSYLLDLDSEAVHVLSETNAPTTPYAA